MKRYDSRYSTVAENPRPNLLLNSSKHTHKTNVPKKIDLEAQLCCLTESLLEEDNSNSTKIVNNLIKNCCNIAELFETHFPKIARNLGDSWIKDKLTFAEVTIATTRLQNLARAFESSYIGNPAGRSIGPEILIATPPGECHTFGATMISREFQKLGASPYLAIGYSADDLRKLVSARNFKLIGISLSDSKFLKSVVNLINTLKPILKPKIPIILGGSLSRTNNELKEVLKVDLITDSASYALEYFNINIVSSENDLVKI